MSDRLPRVTVAQMVRVLERLGFVLVRQKGSHRIYRSAAGNRVTVAYHAGHVLHPKVLRNILKDAGMSEEDLTGSL